jgi:hypothetical protein
VLSGVRRSGAFERLAYAVRKCAKMYAANATTQAATAIIEITSSVVTSAPLVSDSGDPCRRGMGTRLEWSL